MKSDFLVAITQLSAEKNLPKEVVFHAIEAALVSAYKKDQARAEQDIRVKIHPTSGEIKVFARKLVVEDVVDVDNQLALKDARKLNKEVQVDDVIDIEITPANAGRIAAQTAKQVVLQRLREAERDMAFEEYVDKEGQIVMGILQRIEPKQIIVELGKSEAILPATEQIKTERYRIGQRLKVYVAEVKRATKGPQIIVSRAHAELLRRLFELEVPEIRNGNVEIKAIAREAGYRSKVAVTTKQEGLDPVGACVGLRGIRIQNIANELNGERIDVIKWHQDPKVYVANALSPAQVNTVKIKNKELVARVTVPDTQLSLAIGKEGQNVRLAARLVGWKIDIISASEAVGEIEEEIVEPEVIRVEEKIESKLMVKEAEIPEKESVEIQEVVAEPTVKTEITEIRIKEKVEVTPSKEQPAEEEPVLYKPEVVKGITQIRFAEEILPREEKPDLKKKKGKKKKTGFTDEQERADVAYKRKGRRSNITDDLADIDEDYS
ncbi:MAG: transcription termination factor NusA [Chloroflexi bacterium]|nr:transcription termination factor NusA [Chloroflexota bacterium]